RRPSAAERNAGLRRDGAEEVYVVVVGDGGVRRLAMKGPGRARVEGFERALARLHVREAAEPYEAVGMSLDREAAEHARAHGFLLLDEPRLEQLDERVERA